MVTSNKNCKSRVLSYLKNTNLPSTARMISVSTGMQSNTAIKYLKFLVDEGFEIQKGWLSVKRENSIVRVRTYLLKGRV